MTSCTNLRRSEGETRTSSRCRIWSRAVRTSAAIFSVERPPTLGATSASTRSRTLRLEACHPADEARARVAAAFVATACGVRRTGSAAVRSSCSMAASLSESFTVQFPLGVGRAEDGPEHAGEQAPVLLPVGLDGRAGPAVVGEQPGQAGVEPLADLRAR